jgi:GNAT superfamily N-acetyltransferase
MKIDQSFRKEFPWKGQSLRVGFVLPEAKKKISESIAYMSRETIRHRFFGIKNGFTDRELKYLTEVDGYNHFALGIEEVDGEERGVAIARLVRDDQHPNEAEIAILLIDEYQKSGLGTFLMKFCVLAAAERGITTLRFTYLPENTAIVHLIKRFGVPVKNTLSSDYTQMKIKLERESLEKYFNDLKDFFA